VADQQRVTIPTSIERESHPGRILSVLASPIRTVAVGTLPTAMRERAVTPTNPARRRALVRRVVGVVAALAQLALVIASGAEAWHGRDASAHVEQGGIRLHHAHDAATCVACTAQTLQAAASEPLAPISALGDLNAAGAELLAAPPLPHDHHSNGSRAPPRLS